ncbi:MAG: O-antigen ligase family protein [Parasphingorhabdus sp.]|uniref:O-antigen ligase family protein n=1 Tax=Parasphingorhabdus sp. TaxID=2709688 RepID=UPI003296AC5F
MKSSKRTLSTIAAKLSTPVARFYAFMTFFVLVFFTGGGSRDDIQSLLLLRPLAVLFCAYALTVKAPEEWKGRMFPLYIAGALLGLMILQLIPLPPSIWTELPSRQIFADIANIAGIEQPWRPLTLSPSKTLNSLSSLAVPIAAMMLYLNLDREYRKRAVPVIVILCAISALWAILQIVGPARGPLYIYRIANFGTGVGLFANRNHQAVVLAAGIVMLSWYAASLKPRIKQATLKFYGSMATILVFVPLIFLTGSRAGLLLMVPALILALFFIYVGDYNADRFHRRDRSHRRKTSLFSRRGLILVSSLVVITGIAVSSVLLSRSLAFDRLLDVNKVDELRLQLLPTLFAMLKDYFPWGSGFGSFEHVYKIYEPLDLLNLSYLNQAHNDWLQFLIEGGVSALLIAICAFLWFAFHLFQLAKNWRGSGHSKYRALMCAMVILFFLAASIGDYPLRVPSIMAIFAVIISVFNDSVCSVQRHDINQL